MGFLQDVGVGGWQEPLEVQRGRSSGVEDAGLGAGQTPAASWEAVGWGAEPVAADRSEGV